MTSNPFLAIIQIYTLIYIQNRNKLCSFILMLLIFTKYQMVTHGYYILILCNVNDIVGILFLINIPIPANKHGVILVQNCRMKASF